MGLKVAPPSLHWSQPSVPQSPPSSSQALASAISSPSSRRRSFIAGDGALFCRLVSKSGLLNRSFNLHRSQSCGNKRSSVRIIRKSLSASLNSFSDEEFSREIEELALRFELSEDDDHGNAKTNENIDSNGVKFLDNLTPLDALDIERKANSVGIPLSLRIIKKKKQWEGGIVETGESAYCSMKKAFSSMVFIIREIHSYTLQIRSILFYEDLQGILANVQKEIHASFVWLFQTIFSQTPTLMVYVMILLANYSVYSMSSNAAIMAARAQIYESTTEEVSVAENESSSRKKFDSSIIKTVKFPSSSGKTSFVGGTSGGGGGKSRPIASGTEGDGKFEESNYYGEVSMEEEAALWDSIVEEASQMEGGLKEECLDRETRESLVSPVEAKIEGDDFLENFGMDLRYRQGLALEPNNTLLLVNYAQYLHLVVKDIDRAEDYFKRATEVKPLDAEALIKYANFLWLAKNDLWAAEQAYVAAMDAEPDNPFYPSNYAHFLWSTGAEDTCFPSV